MSLYFWVKSLRLNFIYQFLHLRTISGISFLPQPKKMSDSDDIIDPNLVDYEDEEGDEVFDDQEFDDEEGEDLEEGDFEDEDMPLPKKSSNKKNGKMSNKRALADEDDDVRVVK